ncbi:DUF6221 family protein [Streptomyces sp. NPDC058257]|uniref:DUF6221 family protein n=1 Tax=Streptomyces sp. NPDC058257 TaxID=3346409 RepID=UPI0036E940CD
MMPNSVDRLEIANSFERCERLCRLAQEAFGRARQMQSDAVEMRLQAAQTRADRQRRFASPLREDRAAESAPPGAPLPDSTPPAVQLTALAAFVHARLDEEAASADLFHETGCSTAAVPGGHGPPACGCRTPHRMHRKVAARRSIAHISETAVREADHATPGWPRNEMDALLDLRILAVDYELHSLWQEEWRP